MKHPMSSQPPVTTASCGRSPSERLRGRRLEAGGTGLSVHAVTCGRNTSRRHLPACTTKGTLVVAGTPVSVKWPMGSVAAIATLLPTTASQTEHDFVPVTIGERAPVGSAGTKTTAL